MTLLLFLPFNDGYVLMSDRLGSGKEIPDDYCIDKIRKINIDNLELIFAASGTDRLYNLILKEINAKINVITKDNVFDIINDIYYSQVITSGFTKKDQQVDLDDSNDKLSLFVFVVTKSDWNGKIFGEQAIPNLKNTKNIARGCGEKSIKPHLQLDSYHKDRDEILCFGFHLMKYAHISNDKKVGDPELHECDFIFFYNSGEKEELFGRTPKLCKIILDMSTRMLYRFEESDKDEC